MRAVRNSDQGILVAEVDEPEGSGVRLVIASIGICGTDVAFAANGVQGYTYGHEFAGTAADGRSYAVEPTVYCGECGQCRQGHVQRCDDPAHGTLGIFRDGGMCDAITVPGNMLVPLPPGLDVRDACLVEPASVAGHGVRAAALEKGERLAIVGGGSVGLLAAATARQRGFDVDVETRHEHQRIAAERLEAGSVTGTYDVVIDAAGSEAGLARCAELARPGGRVVLLGVYRHTAPVPGIVSLVKELTYVHSIAYSRHDGVRDTEEAAALLAGDPEIARTVITHRFPLDDAAEAFRVAGDRAAGAIKVVLHP
ncbi:zinc-dependent alcohol dehydrogenase [Amycolatopsis regifaucium]|uniref:Zn-dependent alcohol dehydrogenase n=1 Tax=Amycolatopsis regifaucium TaxID=546365 RepID=A0A154MCN6_9PSEU|nr:alcohol dehydrogenase catalytic domain-containing protein [Amycolatopsis regifaucium]KZB81997.1 Zn-dependent alcohol dehydrogenase [Amycolatopsis regifaucium]OKA05929.1 Zn-dependent alcohol dehydrogenase [Amycolatopsis regifaucium]SFG79128.1 Threonine dehydrogenase [Amycolatopsis regifaucium]